MITTATLFIPKPLSLSSPSPYPPPLSGEKYIPGVFLRNSGTSRLPPFSSISAPETVLNAIGVSRSFAISITFDETVTSASAIESRAGS